MSTKMTAHGARAECASMSGVGARVAARRLLKRIGSSARAAVGAFALALCMVHAADALVIDFEDPIDPTFAPFAPLFGSGDEFYQSGFWFDPFSNSPFAQPGDLVGAMVDGTDVPGTCLGLPPPLPVVTATYCLPFAANVTG